MILHGNALPSEEEGRLLDACHPCKDEVRNLKLVLHKVKTNSLNISSVLPCVRVNLPLSQRASAGAGRSV